MPIIVRHSPVFAGAQQASRIGAEEQRQQDFAENLRRQQFEEQQRQFQEQMALRQRQQEMDEANQFEAQNFRNAAFNAEQEQDYQRERLANRSLDLGERRADDADAWRRDQLQARYDLQGNLIQSRYDLQGREQGFRAGENELARNARSDEGAYNRGSREGIAERTITAAEERRAASEAGVSQRAGQVQQRADQRQIADEQRRAEKAELQPFYSEIASINRRKNFLLSRRPDTADAKLFPIWSDEMKALETIEQEKTDELVARQVEMAKRRAPFTAAVNAATQPSMPPAPNTFEAFYATLPSGTEYTAPDGTKRRKP